MLPRNSPLLKVFDDKPGSNLVVIVSVLNKCNPTARKHMELAIRLMTQQARGTCSSVYTQIHCIECPF